MANKLELLSGPAVESALKEADAQVFRYEVNPAGLYIALGIAFAFYGGGGLCYWETQLSSATWTVVFVALMFVGVGFTAVAAYWHQFANQNIVAVSDTRLFVGGPKAMWAIAWEILDRKAMGFDQMQMTRLRGALQMHVGGQHIRLHLFNVIAYLTDIEGLMHGVLSHLRVDEDAVVDDASEEE